jgi:hypothetical protein
MSPTISLPKVAAAAVLVAVLFEPTLAASANVSSSSPVAVDACSVKAMHAGKAAPTQTLAIRFHDAGSEPVSSVDFNVNTGSDVQTIHDAGAFAPGVSIRHLFVRPDNIGSPFFDRPPATCEVESVRFADGSTWSRAHQS